MGHATIAVRVTPHARENKLCGERDGVLLVRVTATPERGRANAALCRLIATRAGVAVRSVSVIRGASSREKVVRVDGLSPAQLAAALGLGER